MQIAAAALSLKGAISIPEHIFLAGEQPLTKFPFNAKTALRSAELFNCTIGLLKPVDSEMASWKSRSRRLGAVLNSFAGWIPRTCYSPAVKFAFRAKIVFNELDYAASSTSSVDPDGLGRNLRKRASKILEWLLESG